LIIDFSAEKCFVNGVSSVSLVRECDPEIYPAGAEFPLAELGQVHWPETPGVGISQAALDLIASAPAETSEEAPPEVLLLLEERRQARERKDWAASDRLRGQIADLGWQVQDTSAEQVLVRSKGAKRS
jgi:cysteinyl-tRNA synthetase